MDNDRIKMHIKMKRQYFLMAMVVLMASGLRAQEYKLAKNTGELNIQEVNHVKIEGYGGKEIIFSSSSYSHDRDDRAKGLRAISGLGLEDNTGLGLSVMEANGVVEVRQLKKMDGPNILIKVPQGMGIKYVHTSPYGSDVEIKNVEGNLSVSTVHNDVKLENTTGLLNVRTVHGDIDARFDAIGKPEGELSWIQIRKLVGQPASGAPPLQRFMTMNRHWLGTTGVVQANTAPGRYAQALNIFL